MKKFLPYLIFIVLFLTAYANSFNNQFISDDIASIQEDPAIRSFSYVSSRWLSAPRGTFYYLGYKLAGPNPLMFRSFNYLFHLGNVFLIYFLIYKLFKNKRAAFFTAALFTVHPLLTESISWISGGAYTQSTFFLLASFVLFTAKNTKAYIASIIFYFLALATQAVTMVLPIILFLYLFSFNELKSWKKIIPFILLSGLWVFIALANVPERETTLQSVHYMERAANNPFLIVPLAVSSYLELIFWPRDLTLYHSELTTTGLEFLLRVLVTLAFFGLLIFSYRKNKKIFFWLSFFVVTLLPTLYTSISNLTWVVAERYAYLGSLGIFTVFSLALVKFSDKKKLKNISWALFALIITLLTVRTILRNVDWDNQDNMWIATGKTSPSSPNTHNNLGDVYGRWGDKQRALEEFQKAIELKPNYGDAYHNLANTYRELGQYDKALENYQNALKYNPGLWQSYQNIAALYFQDKQYDLALENIQKAIQINPKNINLYLNLGIIYLTKGDKEKAREVFSQILSVDPQNQIAAQGLQKANQ